VTFARLNRWDWLAFAAALALLLVMSVDWYSNAQGQECRRIERLQTPSGGVQGDIIGSDVRRSARECAERREKTAWQAPGTIDRFIAFVLVVALASAVAAAFFHAAGRRFEPERSPNALAAWAGLLGSLLILYRILQPPGLNEAAVIKWGAPVGLVCAGVLTIASRSATRAEREEPVEEEADTDETAAVAPDAEDDQATPPSGYEPPPGEPAHST
jgi:drug/metabolite transporter (DMT)-like permease